MKDSLARRDNAKIASSPVSLEMPVVKSACYFAKVKVGGSNPSRDEQSPW
jgi:hypothetical protein